MMAKYRLKKKRAKAKKFDINVWLKTYIEEQVKDEDFVDNLRWAMLGDIEQMDAYNEAVANGCCGSFDGEVTAPDGNTYLVGCNFGH